VRDIEIAGAGLEQAFLQLIGGDDQDVLATLEPTAVEA
jgi:hypothetical protein